MREVVPLSIYVFTAIFPPPSKAKVTLFFLLVLLERSQKTVENTWMRKLSDKIEKN